MKVFIKIKRAFKAIGKSLALLLGVKGEYRKEAEEDGICNYGGQE